jgi:hypothetical protein
MAVQNSGLKAFEAAEDIGAYVRVKIDSSGEAAIAGVNDEWVGTTEHEVDSGHFVTVRMRNVAGTRKMVAGGAITALNRVYGAASGRVDDLATGGPGIGQALTAAAIAGEIVEVLPDPSIGEAEGLLAVAVADSTAVTAATATTFSNASKTIDGTQLKVGDILRIKAAGICTSTTGAETVKVDILVGTEIVMTTGAVDAANGDVFRLEADVAVRVVGASGKLQSHGTHALGVPGTVTAKPFCSAELSEDLSDTTLPVFAQVTNSSTGESILCHSFSVELIRQ